MPIYAYSCSECGHAKDVLQKLSDPALTTCPACGAEAFSKQVTAAGFQLKGSGWYATDFRGGNSPAAASKGDAAPAAADSSQSDKTSKADNADKSDKADKGGKSDKAATPAAAPAAAASAAKPRPPASGAA